MRSCEDNQCYIVIIWLLIVASNLLETHANDIFIDIQYGGKVECVSKVPLLYLCGCKIASTFTLFLVTLEQLSETLKNDLNSYICIV